MKAVVPGGRGVGKYKPLHKPDLQKSDNNPSTSVSLATIGAIEEGQRRRPYLHTLRALADSLELTGPERVALLSFHVDVVHSEEVGAPVPPTPLVGRESEIAEACAVLTSATPAIRLLALIGPGGVGKTRLALEVAATVRDAFSDGAAFVDLAPLCDHRLVPATIARVLGVHESGRQSAREMLVAHLRQRHLLLTLDNFEHLLSATPLVTELLAACPRLSILVTTRSALRVRSERRLVVPPLATPAAAKAPDAAQVAGRPATRAGAGGGARAFAVAAGAAAAFGAPSPPAEQRAG